MQNGMHPVFPSAGLVYHKIPILSRIIIADDATTDKLVKNTCDFRIRLNGMIVVCCVASIKMETAHHSVINQAGNYLLDIHSMMMMAKINKETVP